MRLRVDVAGIEVIENEARGELFSVYDVNTQYELQSRGGARGSSRGYGNGRVGGLLDWFGTTVDPC